MKRREFITLLGGAVAAVAGDHRNKQPAAARRGMADSTNWDGM
jgi:hypothetical protein